VKRTSLNVSSVDTKRVIRIANTVVAGEGAEWRQFTLGRLLIFAYGAYETRILEEYRAAGYPDVRQAHLSVTRHIDVGTGTRISDLAARAGVTKGAMGQLVADCERIGLVTRLPDPVDARATIVELTKRGRALLDVSRRAGIRIEAEFAAAIGAEQGAALRNSLIALREQLAPVKEEG
jgi:DNA-binding MarR family transcriptional regulator